MKHLYLLCHSLIIYTKRIPLAWLQLSHQKTRLFVAVSGVAFSIVLIFTQLGIKAMLFDGVTLLPEHLNGDLYLLSSYSENIRLSSFPSVYLYQANAIKGVEQARPLYVNTGSWVDPKLLNYSEKAQQRQSSLMQILAYNPTQPVFDLPQINQQANRLAVPGGILYDSFAKAKLGAVPETFAAKGKVTSILDNRRVTVVGLFNLGSTFYDEGRAVMSDWNYAQMQGVEKLEEVSVGVLSLKPGTKPQEIIKRIESTLSRDIKVLTPAELVVGEQKFVAEWPEGKVLNFGAAIAFIIGIVVVYQVIYTDVSEHLPEYATLKAIGYSDRTLSLIVLEESFLLAMMGFIPGYLISYGVYYFLFKFVELPVTMNPLITLQVFLLNLIMCLSAGAIAIRKLRTADPADIF